MKPAKDKTDKVIIEAASEKPKPVIIEEIKPEHAAGELHAYIKRAKKIIREYGITDKLILYGAEITNDGNIRVTYRNNLLLFILGLYTNYRITFDKQGKVISIGF